MGAVVNNKKEVNLNSTKIQNENFFKISNVDELCPFFMSIVSDSNHWMFVSSNGGISCGRKNAEFALFPYYTDDKITESAEITGSKTILQVFKNGKLEIWEPLSERFEGKFNVERNLYKNEFGNKIIFEEINHDLEISFSYEWNNSNGFGFVKKSKLKNFSSEILKINVLDGLQNILPYGIGSYLQNNTSNLGDAYKRSELDENSGLGIFALSAIIVDKAEPSEALKANTVFSLGLQNPKYLLSSLQLKNFRKGENISQETDIKGEKGAYFILEEFILNSNEEKKWHFIADVNQSQTSAIELIERLKSNKGLFQKIQKDIDLGTENLVKLVTSSDGIQFTKDSLKDSRHFSNTLFNIMRGGIFDENYQIEKWDFTNYLLKANKIIAENAKEIINQLPEKFTLFDLKEKIITSNNSDLIRLFTEYLPLKFSRRHGDPSRPWNKFSINTRSETEGSKILDYEGNWRDIFQNWEALAHSFPYFMEGMMFKFLNASTFDGYNPYRVTKDGFDWETIEPDDPWSYIGYWGDHQIIYLLKFLEFSEKYFPNSLEMLFDKANFVYANVPYRIKSYEEILKNPKDTIVFLHEKELEVQKKRSEIGADGCLVFVDSEIYHVNFLEKILATILAKLSNFIPEAGIWMNTQRPEWNDANNALVGNGVSMVTLYYLRRFLKFFEPIFDKNKNRKFEISEEMYQFFNGISQTFEQNKSLLSSQISDENRKQILDKLGTSGSNFRNKIYTDGFSGEKSEISAENISSFIKNSLEFLEHSIKKNLRKDGLYHAYNLMTAKENSVEISYLDEMLEGQVAVLSSGFLSPEESLKVLDSLKKSLLFRADQYSYILYPNKNLKGFLQKNFISKSFLETKEILKKLENLHQNIIEKDALGNYHFNGNFRNANDLKSVLNSDNQFNENEKSELLQLFEEIFNHKAFTGRSGTFYGYEGLGSIYWHMVSKLFLATEEVCERAFSESVSSETFGRLLEHYYEIYEGIGVHKSPKLYGAFPTDPYSHTPFKRGAQQPGMTGQVKEDILSRFGELGILVNEGKLHFQPKFLREDEFLKETKSIEFFDVNGEKILMFLNENELFFMVCQVPVIYCISENEGADVFRKNEIFASYRELVLSKEDSENIFKRNGEISLIKVKIKRERLK